MHRRRCIAAASPLHRRCIARACVETFYAVRMLFVHQGLELSYIQVGDKQVARLKIDCRSLIMLRTGADTLLPRPLYGWVSMYSSSATDDLIVTPVPEEHMDPVKSILSARGGYVEPSELEKAAADSKGKGKGKGKGGSLPEAPKADKELHAALTEQAAELVDSMAEEESKKTKKKNDKKKQKAKPKAGEAAGETAKPAKPMSDKEADAVAERSQSRKALAGLKQGKNESKADKFQAKKALEGLKEGKNESKAEGFQAKKAMEQLKEGKNVSKADKFQAQKALAGLKDGKNESKAEAHQKKKAMEALKSPRKPAAAAAEDSDVDPSVREFLEDAVEEISVTQPENPLQVLADKCKDKADEETEETQETTQSADPPSKTISSDSSTAAGPVTTVEEAVRRIKKYHDVGDMGAKKVVVEVRRNANLPTAPR